MINKLEKILEFIILKSAIMSQQQDVNQQQLNFIAELVRLFLRNCHKLSKLNETKTTELEVHSFRFTPFDIQDLITLAAQKT